MSSIDRYSEYFQEYLRSLSKDTYIDILEHCFAEITVTDAEGYVIYANPASLQYHGMSSEDMCKLNFLLPSMGCGHRRLWITPSKISGPFLPGSGI